MDKRNIQEAPTQSAQSEVIFFLPLVFISSRISLSPTFHLMPSIYSHWPLYLAAAIILIS